MGSDLPSLQAVGSPLSIYTGVTGYHRSIFDPFRVCRNEEDRDQAGIGI